MASGGPISREMVQLVKVFSHLMKNNKRLINQAMNRKITINQVV
jgi:hypothetical protein